MVTKAELYKRDIVAWAEDHFYISETRRPIVLEGHQKRILRDVLTPDADGRFPYETVIYSCPKKSGKTTIAAIVALWLALREEWAEVYCCANDLEQSVGRVFKAAKTACQLNPVLSGEARIVASVIEFPATGSFVQAIASEYKGAAGSNPTASVWDELWGYTSEAARRLWDELTPPPTRLSPIRWISTYAGWEGESDLLWELYQRGMDGQRLYDDLPVWVNGDLYCYWDNECRMPWQTARFIEGKRRTERPNAFRRFWRNEWVASEDAFITGDQWDACILPGYRCPGPRQVKGLYLGIDAGVKHDCAAVVAVYPQDGQIWLGPYRIWRPSKRQPLDLEETIEAYVKDLRGKYGITLALADPWQMASTIQRLQKAGIAIREYPQTVPNLTTMGGLLFDLLRQQRLVVYAGATDLRKHVLNSNAKETSRGIRLVKSAAARKIDAAIALAMAVAGVSERPDYGPPGVVRYA